MAITTLTPYLMFNGNAGKAIAHYEKALGAKVEARMPMTEAPGLEKSEYKDRIMHAMLRVGGATLFMSDSMPDAPVTLGGNVQVAIGLDDPADLARKYEALAAGGTPTFPPHDAFWGDRFGMVTDAFGIQWMLSCPLKKP